MRNILVVFGIAVCLLSCKAKQTATAESSEKTTAQTKYNYTVVFNSPGSGIETEIYQEYNSFLNDYKPALTFKYNQYGREGERNFCLDLSGLKEEEVKAFKISSDKITSKGKYIQIFEDGRCR